MLSMKKGHLYIVGLGLSPSMVSMLAIETLRSCDHVFYEEYTSIPSEGSIKDIEILTGKGFEKLSRRDLEDLSAIEIFTRLDKGEKICLASWGDPLTATTHIYIASEAVRRGHGYTYIPGISIATTALGFSGLMIYRLGRVMTMVRPRSSEEAGEIYGKIRRTLDQGMHVLLLLEMDVEKGYYMKIHEACEILLKISKDLGDKDLEGRKALGLAGLGSRSQKICYASIKDLSKIVIEKLPQSILILGQPYFTEQEYIESMVKRYGSCWSLLSSET
ncbi:hypothetical protein ATG_03400 [Desulfurococcaceae archaeon AG1]|jgi:diphthine synthase|nr:MAG: diphthine synthase [Desulfurococcaceae archaeon]GAY25137.1 hypothetical protein ATG_03400 [Desulfurococcaceae archaeon AG1]